MADKPLKPVMVTDQYFEKRYEALERLAEEERANPCEPENIEDEEEEEGEDGEAQ